MENNKIISFSLWGNDLLYWEGAVENIHLAKKLYPGWKCRFYINEASDPTLIRMMEQETCEIFLMKANAAYAGLFWRFYAADDAEIMICRDTDSRLSHRERHAVDRWLDSGRNFHIMRDHPYHGVPILRGMWGARNVKGITHLANLFPDEYKDKKGCDQDFLGTIVYPQIRESACIHDSYNFFNDGTDFPTRRIGNEFVGQVINNV